MEIKVKKEKLEEGKLTEILDRPKIVGFFNGTEYFAVSYTHLTLPTKA